MPTALSLDDQFTTIILAAGKGTRMKSPLPKVLHNICGWPILRHVCEEIKNSGCGEAILVTSEDLYPSLQKLDWLKKLSVHFVIQKNRRGTGDAVAACATVFGYELPEYSAYFLPETFSVPSDQYVLICAGDCPALSAASVRDFVAQCRKHDADLGLLGIRLPVPTGYGRIVVAANKVEKIVEEKDASVAEKSLSLCNSGFICGKSDVLFRLLQTLSPKNAQAEYYLTDIFAAAAQSGLNCHLYEHPKAEEWQGVNDPWQLAQLEVMMVRTLAEQHAKAGVRLILPHTIYLEKQTQIEGGVEISPHVMLKGETFLEEGSSVGHSSYLHNVRVKKDVHIGPYKHLCDCVISEHLP